MKSSTWIFDAVWRWWTIPRLLMALGWLTIAAGCAPATGHVSGVVSWNGAKVPAGTVSFFVGAKVIEAEIDDGAYELTGLPLGKAQITVVRLDARQQDPYEELTRIRRRMSAGRLDGSKDSGTVFVTDQVQINALEKKRHLLPLMYASPETSGLRCTIIAGQNIVDLRLKGDASTE